MPVSSASSKVLRVALVRDGRVVMERLLPHDTDLSIGSDPRNALVVPDTPFGTGTTVMTAEDHGYRVLRTDGMAGKLTVHGEPTVLRGDVGIDPSDRGRLTLGDTTVLFQFVTPPPGGTHRFTAPLDFRPLLVDDDDPVFVGMTAVLTAIAAGFLGFVYVSPAPAHAAVTVVDQRITRVMMAQAPTLAPPEPTEVDATPTGEPTAPSDVSAPRPAAPAAASPSADGDDAPSPLQVLLLSTTGSDGDSAFGRLTGEVDSGQADLDEALRQVTGVRVAQRDDGPRRPGGAAGSREDVGIDILTPLRTGPVQVDDAPDQAIATVTLTRPELDAAVTDADAIQATVQAADGRMTMCYERALKRDSHVAGRVEIEFVVRDGRADPVHVFADTTGDAELTDCLVTAFRRIRFPSSAGGEVLYPMVFAPQR